MLKGLIGAIALVGLIGAAHAQALNSVPTLSCSGYICGYDPEPSCDTKDKTPAEAVQCKLDYWRKEVTRRTKAREDAQSELDKAADRVHAFEAVK